jgi:hypothetical protein
MSFLTDLFEGNTGNLGEDITNAPQSFVTDWSSEAPYVEGAGALAAAIAAPEILPELGAAIGGLDGAAAAAPASLDAANTLFGTFDPASLTADAASAGADGAGTVASLATDSGTLPSTDVATAALPPSDGALPPSADGALPPSVTAFAPAGGGDGSLNSFLANPGGDGSSALAYGGTDGGAPSAQTGLTAANQQFGAYTPPSTPSTPSYVDPSVVNAPPSAQQGLNAASGTFGTFNPSSMNTGGLFGGGGFLGTGLSNMQALTAGAAVAPLGLALAMGEAQLPSSAQQAQANAAILSQFGQANINGTLNAGQLATIANMQQQLTNQMRQQLYNSGVQDPSKDSRSIQMQAYVDQQVTAATAQMINQNITKALTALGSAGTELNQIAQMQMTADQNFTNTLVNATKSLALLAGTNFAGGKTTTTTVSTS